jgi:hypothetical protein
LSGRNAPISFDIWWTLISGTVDADPEDFTKEGPFDEKGNTKLDDDGRPVDETRVALRTIVGLSGD